MKAKVQSNPDLETIVNGNTIFAFDLYNKLKKIEGNLFFSPHSISTALAMTYAGARGNTEKQMAQTLHFTLEQAQLHPAFASMEAKLNSVQQKGSVQLRVANSLWPQKGYAFLEAFLTLTKKYYGVLITPVDYRDTKAARSKINTWVEEKTENKIKELIKPGVLDASAVLVLVNAIYFKGDWASQFQKSLTKNACFWTTPDRSITVPMMTQQDKFKYAANDTLQILELPYDGDDLSMIVLLPKQIDGLTELQNALTVDNLERWNGQLRTTEVQVFLPKFKTSSQFGLGKTLISMGMSDAFSGEADFSGMTGNRELSIGAVIHKAFVDVNEEGTEAAAATAVVMFKAIVEPPPIFRVDHPFIFLIRDNHTGSVLFIGRVVNPGKY
jgi:serpin B